MKNTDRVMRKRKVGEVSSKYGYNPDQFTTDMQRHEAESDALYEAFKEFMKSMEVTPRDFRGLFRKYYEEFIEKPAS